MSQLPVRPSLSHLRKQAKELLRDLRRKNPEARLANAQHALARSYGFDSWPKLKAYVGQAAAAPPPPMFPRFTTKAREAVYFARCEASRRGRITMEHEDVLLGLIRASEGLRRFERLALDRVRTEMTGSRHDREPIPTTERISTGEGARKVFRAAASEADDSNHQQIGLVHILLGVLREAGSTCAALLERNGIALQPLRHDVTELLDEH